MRKRGRRLSLIVVGVIASVVLFVLWLVYATVNETPPYKFMRGVRQDGFSAPVTGERGPVVYRFFLLDAPFAMASKQAMAELNDESRWTIEGNKGNDQPEFKYFVSHRQQSLEFWIEPEGNRTSIVVIEPAAKPIEWLGTVYERIPDRYAELRR